MNFLDDVNNKINDLKVNDYELEVLYSTKFVELRRGKYNLNNGESIIRETAVKKIGVGDAVSIFAVTEDKKILLVIQPRVALPTSDKINIELPAGYVEENEDAVTSGMRELVEETGYVSSNASIIDSYYPSLGASGEKITLVLALDCRREKDLCLDSDEFLHNISVSLEEFKYLLDNNYIKDVNARIGYYKYLEYLRGE